MEETESKPPEQPVTQEMTPVIVENPFLLAMVKKLARMSFITSCVAITNTILLILIFVINQGNQNQIYAETKTAQEVQTTVVMEAVKEETQAAVGEAVKELSDQNKKQSESAMRQLHTLTNAAKQPKVVKKQ